MITKTNNRTLLAMSGVTYDFDFRIDATTDLEVYGIAADGTATEITTGFTVTFSAADEEGTVTFGAEPSTYAQILMLRNRPYTQDVDVPIRGGFSEEDIEKGLDKIVIQIQQLADGLSKTVSIPLTSDEDPPDYLELIDDATAGAAAAQAAAEVAQGLAEDARDASVVAQGLAEDARDTAIAQVGTVVDGAIQFVMDGQSAALGAGVVGDIYVPFAMTLTGWTLLADQSGAIKIDIWKDTYANFPPTDADTITNGHEPEIAASGVKAQDLDIADWVGEAIDAGSTLRVNIDSVATIQRCVLVLNFTRTVA